MVGYRVMDRDAVTMGKLLVDELTDRGLAQLPVVIGGIVQRAAREKLEGLGVSRVFGPGSKLSDISDFVHAKSSGAPS